MGSGLTFNRETQWLIAVGISVGLHVGLLVLLAACHKGTNVQALLDGEKPEQVEVSDAKPSPSVAEPEPAQADAPSVAEKPKTEKPKTAKPKPKPDKPKAEKPKRDKPVEPPSEQADSTDDPLAWPDEDVPERPSAKVETYVVKRGESLSSIAKELGCSLTELVRMNGGSLKKLSNLRVGQRIKVPRRD